MAKEKKNTAYDRKGAFRKWILCTKRKDRQKKDISFDKQTRRRHNNNRRPTQHKPHSLIQIFFAKKKKNTINLYKPNTVLHV